MKIDDRHKPKGATSCISRLPEATGRKPHPRHRPSKVQTADHIHLSPRALAYAKARKTLSALPDIDANKVREIQDRLQSGRYHVDPDKIAAKMIEDLLASDE